MFFAVLSINWTGQAVTGEQLLVLRNVAAQHLRMQKKFWTINFAHELCEGQLTRGKEGVFGVFGGTFFHADLGTVRGERWTVDFLLPHGSEHIAIHDDSVVVSTKPLAGGELEITRVDHAKAKPRTVH